MKRCVGGEVPVRWSRKTRQKEVDKVVRRHQHCKGRLLGLALVTLSGCAISGPEKSTGLSGYAEVQNRASSPAALGGGESEFGGSGYGIASTVREFGHSVSSTLRPESRTIPASDPTRLDSGASTASAGLHVQAARVYESRGDHLQALHHYESALLASPDNVKILLAIARLHDRNGEWVQAESYYLRASDADPQNAGAFNDLGLCYARQSKFDEAASALEFAVQQEPENLRYRNNLAAVLVEAGRPADALHHLIGVHSPAVAHYNVGYLLAKRGQPKQAGDYLAAAVQADPSLAVAQSLLNSVRESGTPRVPATLTSESGDPQSSQPLMRRLPPV